MSQHNLQLFTFLVLACLVMAGCQKNEGGQIAPTAMKGYLTGKVTDTRGNPVAGAEILVDHAIYYGSYITGTTDQQGNYKIRLPRGVYNSFAFIKKKYNHQLYKIACLPDAWETFDEEGAIRNFSWKLEGRMPYDDYQYFGGLIEVNTDIGFPHDINDIELILTPDGPLIDGSAGKVIRMRHGTHYWTKTFEIEDVPIGRYMVNAFLKAGSGSVPLKLRNGETGGSFAKDYFLDFIAEPKNTTVRNSASIIIGE